jgi:hypothetical protein
MSFQGEMTSRIKVDLGPRIVPPERFRTGRQEKRIILAPHRQQRRLVLSEVSLELRIERDVAGVVEQQIELRLMRPPPGQIVVIQRAAVGRYERRICYPSS